MAGSSGRHKFGNDVQRIGGGDHAHGRVAVNQQALLAGAGAMAAQAGFILIDGGDEDGDSVEGADAGGTLLRGTHCRRRSIRNSFRVSGVGVVAVDAGGVAVVVQHRRFGGIVKIISGRQADD